MNKLLAALTFFFCSTLSATEQIPDALIVNGAMLWLDSDLGGVPRELLLKYGPVGYCSASARGYRKVWEIRDGMLLLLRVEVNPCSSNPTLIPLGELYPGAVDAAPATWLTGDVVVRLGARKYQRGAGVVFEPYLAYAVERGRVVSAAIQTWEQVRTNQSIAAFERDYKIAMQYVAQGRVAYAVNAFLVGLSNRGHVPSSKALAEILSRGKGDQKADPINAEKHWRLAQAEYPASIRERIEEIREAPRREQRELDAKARELAAQERAAKVAREEAECAKVPLLKRHLPADTKTYNPLEQIFRHAETLMWESKVSQAVRLFQEASAAGHGPSSKRLADIFINGGVDGKRDLAEARKYRDLARQQGERIWGFEPLAPTGNATGANQAIPAVPATITYTGGTGTTPNDAVVINGAANIMVAVSAEAAWLNKNYPRHALQLQFIANDGGKRYDAVRLMTIDCKLVTVNFDSTSFFGKS